MALNNQQYDEIMRMYQKRQWDRNHLIQERTEEAYTKIPALQEIDDAIADASMEEMRSRLELSQATASSDLHTRIEELKQRRFLLLEEHGYGRDYLSPAYHCPDCKDTGYIGNQRCHCFEQAAIDFIYKQSNLASILAKENFDHFDLTFYNDQKFDADINGNARENAASALAYCKSFCENFQKDRGNILLYGDTGTGKTFLTHCITNALINQGFSVIYFTAFQLFDIFQKVTFQKDVDAEKEYENIFSCDLLIIDDLGTEFANSFTNAQLFLCLNERLLRGKSMVISTNLSPGEIANNYSERVISRISSEYKLIKLFGDDIRIQKKINNR